MRRRLMLTFVSLLIMMAIGQAPAFASCALAVPGSPYAFVGVVVSTQSHGRVAGVRTAAGEMVEVRGTPDTAENAASSADRTYEVGGRYEFHPVNASSPFDDNSCTQTRLLSRTSSSDGGAAAQTDGASDGVRAGATIGGGAAGQADGTSDRVRAGAAIGGGAVLLAGLVAVATTRRRRRPDRRGVGQGD